MEVHNEKHGPKKGSTSGLIGMLKGLASRAGGRVDVVRRAGEEA